MLGRAMNGSFQKKRRSRRRFDGLPKSTIVSSGQGLDSRTHQELRPSVASTPSLPMDGAPSTVVQTSARAAGTAPILMEDAVRVSTADLRYGEDHEYFYDGSSGDNGTTGALSPARETSEDQDCNLGESTPSNASLRVPACPDPDSFVKISSWRVLLGLILTNGSHKMTKSHYQALRVILDSFFKLNDTQRNSGSDTGSYPFPSLPHFVTLHRTFRPIVFRSFAVRGEAHVAVMDPRKAGARSRSFIADGLPQSQVKIVLPSEYAREDIATGPIFDLICSTSLDGHEQSGLEVQSPAINSAECVDIWPVVAARKWFYGPSTTSSTDTNGTADFRFSYAEMGDVCEVSVTGSPNLHASLRKSFLAASSTANNTQLQGTVSHIWTVHNSKRRNIPEFQLSWPHLLPQRDKDVSARFGFVTYCSPSDSFHADIPELPSDTQDSFGLQEDCGNAGSTSRRSAANVSPEMAELMRRRKTALRQRKMQIESAWSRWTKPGDTVTLLRPCMSSDFPGQASLQAAARGLLSEVDLRARLCIVHRFWTEREERNRHVFWVPGDLDLHSHQPFVEDLSPYFSTICTDSQEMILSVLSTKVVKEHSGKRGPEKFRPVSSLGSLANGEKYVIYRFVLFWDGFEITTGKSASGEGFYMLCLNLPLTARSSPNAVRIISLVPPGVCPKTVFARIKDDIITGLTDGFLDFDAKGNLRRIVLDLVGFVGDTPALNSTLDVLGHTASAFCHLCGFHRRSSTLVGSRFTGIGQHGRVSSVARGFYQHCAVRDSGAGAETCRLLGMKPSVSDFASPIHELRDAMMDARRYIPTTENGMPILSGYLDPYKSCFVSPDHLLTGHFRDCFNLVLKLLPSRKHRVACEAFIMGYLSDCNLRTQNRIVDFEKKSLYSMSMSELYSIALVAELGFIKGCASVTSQAVSGKCYDAIALLGSCSRLIVELWRLPNAAQDGERACISFNANSGWNELQRIRAQGIGHILEVQKVCTMVDDDVVAMEDTTISRARRALLAKEHSSCVLAIKTVDKPNVHRLYELLFTTIPMIGHVSRVGELVLEKAHQSLKRAIRQSNNRDVQLLSMQSIIFNDWLGRLSLLVHDAVQGDTDCLRGCFRFLSGRGALFGIRAHLLPEHEKEVKKALGPDSCIPALLKSNCSTVISQRCLFAGKLVWVLHPDSSNVGEFNTFRDECRRRAREALLTALMPPASFPDIEFGDSVSSTLLNGLPGVRLSCGDVFETLCYDPESLRSHAPFAMQANVVAMEPDLQRECAPMFWCATTFFKISKSSASTQIFAAALPCVTLQDVPENQSYGRNYKTYILDSSISFVTIDPSIRKVGILHDCCPLSCTTVSTRGVIQHCENSDPLHGGKFFLKSRTEGYPPRKG